MIQIKYSTFSKDGTIIRQTPHSQGRWDDCQFDIDTEIPGKKYDWWVVYDGVAKEEQAYCSPDRTILVTGEPPSIKRYDKKFLKQFGHVITVQDILGDNVTHMQTALAWNIGKKVIGKKLLEISKDYDEVHSTALPPKSKIISVVTSNKAYTPGHRDRLQFVKTLQDHFGPTLDVYGPGLGSDLSYDQGIHFLYHTDKWEAVADYKYHIVIENSVYKDYWSEKLTDAYLAGSYPFYYGCPNLIDYFPAGSFTAINTLDPVGAIAIIEETIKKETYQKAQPLIENAKNLILDSYQIFPMIVRLVHERLPQIMRRPVQLVTLNPEQRYKKFDNFIQAVKRQVRRTLSRKK